MTWLRDPRGLAQLVRDWRGVRVVVLGDALLDEWCYGEPERLCREAPVPIVGVNRIETAAGGAANTAVNIAALGGHPVLVAPFGDDREGSRLRECLTQAGVEVRPVLVNGWRTPSKQRIVAGDQIVVRLDGGRREDMPEQACDELAAVAEAAMSPAPAAVAVCDYGYGVLGHRLLQVLRERRGAVPVVAVDAHELARLRELRPTLVTPSFAEAADVMGVPGGATDRVSLIEQQAHLMLEQTGAHVAAVTLDTDGALVVGRGAPPVRTTTPAAPESHAVGAGDVYLAALTLATATGADYVAGAALAQLAAEVAVGSLGTCVCPAAALIARLGDGTDRALEPAELLAQVGTRRVKGERVVFTNGCFDVLHRGHVSFLSQARSLGDLLVVAVNSDASVSRLKGPDRPVNHEEDRAAVLAALSCVDYVVLFDQDSPGRLIELVRPDVYVKGGDYRAELLPEAELVRDLGGEVRILDYVPDRSTSAIIERIRAHPAGQPG